MDACWDVVGIGANSLDNVAVLPAVPQQFGPSSKMRIRQQVLCCGGQVATALATCTRFGLTSRYIGVVGTDENGQRVRTQLAAYGIDTADLIEREGRNQFALILLDESTGERIVLWDRDERLLLAEDDLPLNTLAAARVIHVDDVDERTAIAAARFGRSREIPVTSDLDRLTPRTGELVAAVTIPIFAEHLPRQLTGAADDETALRHLRRSHEGLLVVTLGPRGSMALEGDTLHVAPALHIQPVDTTGCGDVFRGAFIYGLLQGWPVDRLLRFANAAAAVSCLRLGAMNGVPSLEETERMMTERLAF